MTYQGLERSIIYCHGPEKAGKTTLFDSFPNARFIACEPGHRFIKSPVDVITCWKDLQNVKIPKEPGWDIIDPLGGLHEFAFEKICADNTCWHPSTRGEFGKMIWSQIRICFTQWLRDFTFASQKAGRGVVWIDHTDQQVLETPLGEVTKLVGHMTAQGKTGRIIKALPDHQWFLGYAEPGEGKAASPTTLLEHFRDTRALWVQGGNLVQAGTRDTELKTRRIFPLERKDGYSQLIKELETDDQ